MGGEGEGEWWGGRLLIFRYTSITSGSLPHVEPFA